MKKEEIREEGTIITKKGMQLISKLLASGQALAFTKVEIGSGHAVSGTDLENLTCLVSYVRDGHIAKCFPSPEKNLASVVCQVSSIGTKSGFVATEAGLYAQDPDVGEILYAYLDMWDDPQYIYEESSAISKFFEITMSVVISKVQNVTAIISPYSMISREEFNELLEEIARRGRVTINTADKKLEENEIRLIAGKLPWGAAAAAGIRNADGSISAAATSDGRRIGIKQG